MLREDIVEYSSLPQDEGITPSSRFISSRSGPPDHNKRDFKLATILTVGVIVTALGLAATLPFVLREKFQSEVSDVDKSSEDSDNDNFALSHLSGGDGDFAIVDVPENSDQENASLEIKEKTSSEPLQNIVTTPVAKEPVPDDINPTEKPDNIPKPVKVTFWDDTNNAEKTTKLPDLSFSSTNGDDIADASFGPDDSIPENPKPAGVEMNSTKEGSDVPGVDTAVGEDKIDEAGETNEKPDLDSLPATNVPETHKDGDMDMNQLLNEIYGDEGKPSKVSKTSWMNNTQDKVTLVILAAVVAVALASVLAAVAWLIHARIVQRRRRINIQSVITDLQSRDKIVLLNSESEEE